MDGQVTRKKATATMFIAALMAISVAFLVFALLVSYWLIKASIDDMRLVTGGTRAIAQVSQVHCRKTCWGTVSFSDADANRHVAVVSTLADEGETTTILYDKADPSKVIPDTLYHKYFVPIFLAFMGGMIVLSILLSFVDAMKVARGGMNREEYMEESPFMAMITIVPWLIMRDWAQKRGKRGGTPGQD